ncbi:MATE efflux family protein [Clostridium bornimense]|uniref:Probable multidrug resistance protein NorM n=1 Tax=Clostridium bornimense TaxID=1216932 RepID=W6S3U5_9CLOT|nr:MATE family efflux transporter [Clostridium bornimense]CDM68992.1 MATE efflux family protein [Clostridium bornimense]
MNKSINLTEGNIYKALIKISLPIMGTSFIQMAYNMIDMIWIGRVGTSAVAAVGTAGFYTWFATSLLVLFRASIEIKVSQEVGAQNYKSAKKYITSGVLATLMLAVIYMTIMLVFTKPLIGFYNIKDRAVVKMSEEFLRIVSLGMIFTFINPVLTGIFNGTGDSRTPFYINIVGLIFNIICDPLLIFGIGPIKAMGVAGAAIATVLAQGIVTLLFIIIIIRSKNNIYKIKFREEFDIYCVKILFRIGWAPALQNMLFTIFSMILGRIISVWGPVPIAVQKVGSQIEAISWMTAGGISTALTTFVGQNFGAKKYKRIVQGYYSAIVIAIIVGTFATLLFAIFGEEIFSIFVSEKESIVAGGIYLRILGYSQLFMCLEITTAGVFNGLSRTGIPSVISIVLTGMRVPLAYLLSKPYIMGLNGVWWSLSVSSIAKGVLIIGIFIVLLKKQKLFNNKVILQGN